MALTIQLFSLLFLLDHILLFLCLSDGETSTTRAPGTDVHWFVYVICHKRDQFELLSSS